jgi:L-2-hydroxyglutarate oxidase LhgO
VALPLVYRAQKRRTLYRHTHHNTRMSESVETVVIGAGVVGLAVARALAVGGREVIVLEKNARIGEETSSRNSEVIHAGIYYPTDSLKARLCVAGKQLLYAYAEKKGIGCRRTGKSIVAIDESQEGKLSDIARQAARNGVDDLRWLDKSELSRKEPQVRGVRALWSPSTGIVDAHALMLSLQADLEAAGGAVALRAELVSSTLTADGLRLEVNDDGRSSELDVHTLINAAGLHAESVARLMPPSPSFDVPRTYLARGTYFLYSGKSPFEHLVYPLPVEGGLGIHATLDLAGKLRFGPDVEWIDAIDYSIDESKALRFYRAVREYWPELPDGSLQPGYAGIRPKLSAPGEAVADFRIQAADYPHGTRTVHLFGIESPGLTSALAIGEHVVQMLR